MSKYQTCLGILYKCTKEHGKVQEHSQEPYDSICNRTLFFETPCTKASNQVQNNKLFPGIPLLLLKNATNALQKTTSQ